MSYTKRLVGKINPEAEKLQIEVGKSHFSDLETLAADYGWVGKGFKVILNKPAVKDSLRRGGVSELLIGNDNVQGLEVFDEPDRNVLVHLLSRQHGRSLPIYHAAQSGELEQYEDVSIGVAKGVLLGFVVGNLLDRAGFHGPLPEMLARLGPGTLESSAIAHEVEKGKSEKSKNLIEKIITAARELPRDSVAIVKRMPRGLYEGINVYGLIDRMRGLRRVSNNHTTHTEVWSEAQESAPYRGVLGLGLLKSIDQYVSSIPKLLYAPLDLLGGFWVNTGNNVQGLVAVYKKVKESTNSRISAARKIIDPRVADPFQFTNVVIVGSWLTGRFILREIYGVKAENYWGNTGAGMESAIQSCDTAVAALLAKPLIYTQLMLPARLSVRDVNLRRLGNQYGSNYFARASK